MDLEKLRYPIGRFKSPEIFNDDIRAQLIKNIENLPGMIEKITADLNDEQLDTPYRPDGWTVRQVVHHLADSHINSYVRFKWTLTENEPIIKAYDEKRWAELPEAKSADIDSSIALLKGLHFRWVTFLKAMDEQDFNKQLIHPETSKKLSLNWMVALYSWHGLHHSAHISELSKRNEW